MNRRFSEEFFRIERIGNNESNNLIDPLNIQVVLHDARHVVYQTGKPVRASRGRYWVEFNVDTLVPGETYSIFWQYQPISDVVQVKRHDFVWKPIYGADTPDGYCTIQGVMTDGVGMPLNNKEVIIVQYDDFVVKNNISSKVIEYTDCYGQWNFLAQWGHIYQTIVNNREQKIFIVPEAKTYEYSKLTLFQYAAVANTDKFGNPINGTRIEDVVNRFSMGPKRVV